MLYYLRNYQVIVVVAVEVVELVVIVVVLVVAEAMVVIAVVIAFAIVVLNFAPLNHLNIFISSACNMTSNDCRCVVIAGLGQPMLF